MSHIPGSSVRDHMKWAGLLGCEAVLSSMALMQASSIAAPKKMISPLGPASGHGSAQRDAQDRGMQGHMVLPTSMTCPPLLLRKEVDFTAPRLLDEKEMRPNEDMQLKKKNRKSGTPSKVREQDGQAGKAVVDENGNCPLSKVQKNFICDHCYGAFRSGYHLKRHILIHTGEKPFACGVCDMRFIQRYHLERHSLTHTGVKPFACSMCDMRFFQRYHLERHSLTHTGVKPYACTMCDMRFFQRYHLQRHSLIHTGVKPYACSMCDRRFFQRYHLQRHSLTHTGVKPYACSMCDMRFFHRYHLQRHSLTHTGVKPYACTMCDMRFFQRYHLQRHSLTHTGVKPYACSMCDMRFFQRYHLQRHSLTHTGVKPYACSMCDMRFFQRYHLERHSLTHTELLPDRQTVETPAIVSGSWRGKSRGPALFFHPGASRSPSVHVESSTSRPGPTRCLTPYSLDDSTPRPLSEPLAPWLHLLTERCATDRVRGNSPLLFLYLETNKVLF
uniref:C2H2-type domain-containing protein n=1 Tax=Cyprinus carpio TaxID=7962 RepID=A0A8C1M700_CYPCA